MLDFNGLNVAYSVSVRFVLRWDQPSGVTYSWRAILTDFPCENESVQTKRATVNHKIKKTEAGKWRFFPSDAKPGSSCTLCVV